MLTLRGHILVCIGTAPEKVCVEPFPCLQCRIKPFALYVPGTRLSLVLVCSDSKLLQLFRTF